MPFFRSMRRVTVVTAGLLLATSCTDAPGDTSAAGVDPSGSASASASPPRTEAVLGAMSRLPTEGLWPGFSPASIPVALFDGERTLLVGHAAPPEGFTPLEGTDDVHAYPGRHPAVRGNMPTEIGGVRVAAVLLNELVGLTPERAAAVVTHERFHVHQLERHPDWTVNELARFQYPSTDVQQLFDRRLETLALHRALGAQTPDRSECWLRTALILRRKRMGELPPAVAAFERGTERQEGLARYLERRAAGIQTVPDLAPSGYAPEDVRGRAYVTGEALALMLDRYARGWKDALENSANEVPPLDSLLWSALLERPETSCGFSAAERADVLERAADAVDVTLVRRESALRSFESRPGWRLRVMTESRPLWPQSFDPMRVMRVGSARLVHERMLRAGSDAGYIDVYDRPALTMGYLEDPLGSGIREVLVTGLAERPVVTIQQDGGVRIAAPGVEAAFAVARVTEHAQELVVRVR
ncbi:MAG TPA: hypothetical protein VMN78_10515 [Longimicrobiales bacterium]|nr:hypothetical protein [Longimicrobiales bacterium]